MKTFVDATEEFLNGLDYLGDLDSATLTAFRVAAVELDNNFRTTLLTEYRRQLEAIKAYGRKDEKEEPDTLFEPLSGLEKR